ncbi:hypothetical protein [Kutzneria buriramensis]|uniref:Uncharacterized protein n=1 Tax=Kutzneria buriramensis TaxID=1045776 RepID=A0A3E0H328_9PSEU|nr:hypothetical protein [Kutzneria buriramensis]REH36392.1 hypothetical protein BCF44_116262 [Kutzneria buriramensis]
MVEQLRGDRTLIAATDPDGLISYCFAGPLDTAYEVLDRTLVRLLSDEETVEHSCATLIDRTVLERIDFFDKLPSIPFHAPPVGLRRVTAARAESSIPTGQADVCIHRGDSTEPARLQTQPPCKSGASYSCYTQLGSSAGSKWGADTRAGQS